MKLYVAADAKSEIERAKELQRRGVPVHLIRLRVGYAAQGHHWLRYAVPAALAAALLIAAD